MAQSLHYNDTHLTQLTVESVDMGLGAPQKLNYHPIPYSYGGVADTSHPEERIITVRAFIDGADKADFEEKLGIVSRTLREGRVNPKSLRFDHFFPDRFWLAKLRGSQPLRAMIGKRFAQFGLEFLAPEGVAFSVDETDEEEDITSDPQTFNISVGGDENARPVYTVVNEDSQDTTYVTIENKTTDVSLTWIGTLEQNDRVRFDTQRLIVERSTDDGTSWVAMMGGLPEAVHSFPELAPNQTNEIEVSGVSDGKFAYKFRDRFA